jgi:hypothetical protein
VLASEGSDEARARSVIVDRRLDSRRIEVLPAAADRAQRESCIIEKFLEDLGWLLQVLRHVVLKRLESMVAVACRHLDACFGMRRRGSKLVPAHRIAHLVARQRKRLGRNDGSNSCAQKFTTAQHGQPPADQMIGTTFLHRRDGSATAWCCW